MILNILKRIIKGIYHTITTIIKIVIVTGCITTSIAVGYTFAVLKDTPKTNLNEFKYLAETSFIYDEEGSLLDEVPTLEKRIKVSSKDIPDVLKKAFVATEDKRFYEHQGVDFKRLLGAVKATVTTKITGDGNVEGGSTITQQLVKNVILTPDRTIKRKIQEMILATIVSEHISKDEVLTLYLNTIHLGGYAHGVELACKQYFGKSVKDITLIESAFLAGITQSPNEYYPFSDENVKDPSLYLNRTETVLDLMLEQNYIKADEYKKAVDDLHNGKLKFIAPAIAPAKVKYTLNYEWFNRELIEQVKKDLMSKYDYDYTQVSALVANGGLKIYSTMDKDIQRYSENVIYNAGDYIDINELEDLNGMKQPQISAVITDYKTGKVIAAVGGREPQDAFTLNRAISENFLKPTGSTVKPFTVYAPAIETGLYTANSIVSDAPLSSSFLKKYNYSFQPQNDQLTYFGNITLQSALARSLNTVALSTVDKIGLSNSEAYGELFGFKYNSESKNSIAAVALGQFNNNPEDLDGANPMIVAEAFGVFGNSGIRTKSILYTKVLDRNGNVLLENKPKRTQIITSNTAYTMFKMMEATLKVNTSNVALFDGMPIAGKSGTSEDSQNLWFGGLTSYYSCAVWTGSDNPQTITNSYGVPMYGNNTSGIIWREIMKYAHKNLAYKDLEKPTVNEAPISHENITTSQKYEINDTAKEQYEQAKKEEAERLREEEAQRKAEEARKKAEELKKQQEEQKRKEEEERKKKQEEDKKKQEEEDKKNENTTPVTPTVPIQPPTETTPQNPNDNSSNSDPTKPIENETPTDEDNEDDDDDDVIFD